MPNIVETARTASFLTAFVDALQTTGLLELLTATGPFTLFAPTNEAFAALSPEMSAALLKDVQLLKDLLSYHIVPESIVPKVLLDRRFLKTLYGQRLTVELLLTVDEVDDLGEPGSENREIPELITDEGPAYASLHADVTQVGNSDRETHDGIPDDVVLTEEAIMTTVLLEYVTVNNANILHAMSAENGALYALDAVLLPRARPKQK